MTDVRKRSKAGRLALVRGEDGRLATVAADPGAADELVEVFRDGQVLRRHTFAEIRGRARAGQLPEAD